LVSSDVSTIGKPRYERAELDFYPTPKEVTQAILPHLPENVIFWEPCYGNGAISSVLEDVGWTYKSDVKTYVDTYDGSCKHDFLTQKPRFNEPVCIVTNPPYAKSREFVARALELSQVVRAFFLLRHEWDALAASLPLVTHPSFKCKYVLKKRPRWIEGTSTAPRFPYAWYEWDKKLKGPPTIIYGLEPKTEW
jgi:hypothetical protein